MENPSAHILIDMSYFIFYRYYALIKWWNYANKDIPFDISNIESNIEFLEKFEKTFVEKIKEIPKKLNLLRDKKRTNQKQPNSPQNIHYYAAKDCKRDDIWRIDIYSKYKESRVYDDVTGNALTTIFNIAYRILANMNIPILNHHRLEGDDCIALATKNILLSDTDANIYIIANDMDFLQLSKKNVKLINLKYEDLTNNRKSHKDPEKDLFCKILMGDKSDNIPSIFAKCGIKTALKCYNDREYFNQKLKKENEEDDYKRNKKLIDFNEIPSQYNYTI